MRTFSDILKFYIDHWLVLFILIVIFSIVFVLNNISTVIPELLYITGIPYIIINIIYVIIYIIALIKIVSKSKFMSADSFEVILHILSAVIVPGVLPYQALYV